jgi:ADP-ribosylglycohydrolase
MRKKFLLAIVTLLCLSDTSHTFAEEVPLSKVRGAILGSAIGDALGRVPEVYWIQNNRAQWYKDFPNGISSFADFRPKDFIGGKAIYTDDTQMTLCTLYGILNYCWKACPVLEVIPPIPVWKRDDDILMLHIAMEFAKWVVDPDGGLSPVRAPGIGCTKASRRLRSVIEQLRNGSLYIEKIPSDWWAQGEGGELKPSKEGGCGSVMRAYPFGILFHNNIFLACELAAKHSLLTHRDPLAQAACAAMAAAVVMAIRNAPPDILLQTMVEAAEHYDLKTALMIQQAINHAKTNPSKEKIIEYLEKLEGKLGNQAIAATAFIFAIEHKNLLRAIQLAINFYGDSDSVGAMVGALVGAYVGDSELNDKNNFTNWLKPLENLHKLSVDIPNKVYNYLLYRR